MKVMCLGLIFLLAMGLTSASLLDFFKPGMTGAVVDSDTVIYGYKDALVFIKPNSNVAVADKYYTTSDVSPLNGAEVSIYELGADVFEEDGTYIYEINGMHSVLKVGDVAHLTTYRGLGFDLLLESVVVDGDDLVSTFKIVCPVENKLIISGLKDSGTVGNTYVFSYDGEVYELEVILWNDNRESVGYSISNIDGDNVGPYFTIIGGPESNPYPYLVDLDNTGITDFDFWTVAFIDQEDGEYSAILYAVQDLSGLRTLYYKAYFEKNDNRNIFSVGGTEINEFGKFVDAELYSIYPWSMSETSGVKNSIYTFYPINSQGENIISESYQFPRLSVGGSLDLSLIEMGDEISSYFLDLDEINDDDVSVFSPIITSTGLIDPVEGDCESCSDNDGIDVCFDAYRRDIVTSEDAVACSNVWKDSNVGREASIDFLLEGYEKYKVDNDLSEFLFHISAFNRDDIPVTSSTCGEVLIDECGLREGGPFGDSPKLLECVAEYIDIELESVGNSDWDFSMENDAYNCINEWKDVNTGDFNSYLVDDFKICTDSYIVGDLSIELWNNLCFSKFKKNEEIVFESCGNIFVDDCDEIEKVIGCMNNYAEDSSLYAPAIQCIRKFNKAHIGESDLVGTNLSLGATLENCLAYEYRELENPIEESFESCVSHVNAWVDPECLSNSECGDDYRCDLATKTCVLIGGIQDDIEFCGEISMVQCEEQDGGLDTCRNSYWNGEEGVGLSELLACISSFNIANNPGSYVYTCADRNYQDGLPTGSRVDDASLGRAYCSLSGRLLKMVEADRDCNNDFECVSNACIEGKCYNLAEEIKSQTGVLKKVWCVISSGFSSTNEAYLSCIGISGSN